MTVRTSEFNKALRKFKKDLEEKVNNKLLEVAKTSSILVCKKFVKKASTLLKNRTNQYDEQSAMIVNDIANSITYKQVENSKNKTKYVIVIPTRNNNTMFLEYGTGIAGLYNKHPEADKFGWSYVLHPEHYKRPIKIIKNLKYNEYGWFYNKNKNSYLSTDDEENITFTYETKKGLRTRTINAVFTQGIKPVRFIYDTKQSIIRAINNSRTIKDFREELKKI